MTLPTGYFDELYASADDPWSLETRWYERRKYALTLAALPRPRYRYAFEPGCSVGVLTHSLARRCDRLLAVDATEAAVARTRQRLAADPWVEVGQARLPDWPPGLFDLVVLSEVGYYLDDADLTTTLDAAVASLEPAGDLVAVHWRHPVADYPRSGDSVHAALAQQPGITRVSRIDEADFLLDVYTRVPPAARSVAQRDGLA